ncbi:MAG: hypothetical protein EB120_08525 [Proteobacteria bacterium]|nr:hypothetical protein [Pseudomonadota bacterium]NDG27204.1 hypothetical protein [Pseudomonadota bacterium]
MLRKTTVYLSDEDMLLLRKMANIRNVTVAEAIRLSIKDSCKPRDKEEKQVWDSLDKIWAKTAAINPSKIEKAVGKAMREVRSGRKGRSRS